MLELPPSTNVPGPEQRAGTFNSDPDAARELTVLDQRGSKAVFGNLLTLPIGGTLVYVQPIYLQAESGAQIPQLKRVFVGVGSQIGFADTLAGALDQVFGAGAGAGVDPGPGATPDPAPGGGGGDNPALRQAIADASAGLRRRRGRAATRRLHGVRRGAGPTPRGARARGAGERHVVAIVNRVAVGLARSVAEPVVGRRPGRVAPTASLPEGAPRPRLTSPTRGGAAR